jgi:hypothetical protein
MGGVGGAKLCAVILEGWCQWRQWQIRRLWKMYEYIFTLTKMDNYVRRNQLRYKENIQVLFTLPKKGQITY